MPSTTEDLPMRWKNLLCGLALALFLIPPQGFLFIPNPPFTRQDDHCRCE